MLHEGKLIDTFCKDHNKVFCGACAVVKHRSCATVSIAIAAKYFKSSPEMKKFKDAMNEDLEQCKQEKEKRADNLDSVEQQKLESIDNVDKYEEKLIAKIKELADISRQEIRSKYEENKTALDTDIEALDVTIATAEGFVDKLKETNDELLFVIVKTSLEVPKDGEKLLQAMSNDGKERVIQYYFDATLEDSVLKMKSLGRLGESKKDLVVKEYQAKFDASVNINHMGDYSITEIFDICLMDSNDILLTDYQYNQLKRFDSNLQFKDTITLSGYPIAVCKLSKHEVAVRIQSSKVVKIVSVGETLQLTSSFTLADAGWGMTYDAESGEILACEGSKVSVYNKAGNKVRTYDKDNNGKSMFSVCRQIALSDNGHDVYVTDHKKGLIVFDKNGTVKMKVSLSGVSSMWPLCLLPGGICLIGSSASNMLYQVDNSGKQVGSSIECKDGRTVTLCAVYDRDHSRLLVGGDQSLMTVYTLTAK